jgi:hypothetical protein
VKSDSNYHLGNLEVGQLITLRNYFSLVATTGEPARALLYICASFSGLGDFRQRSLFVPFLANRSFMRLLGLQTCGRSEDHI